MIRPNDYPVAGGYGRLPKRRSYCIHSHLRYLRSSPVRALAKATSALRITALTKRANIYRRAGYPALLIYKEPICIALNAAIYPK